jgi:hypothetical protein
MRPMGAWLIVPVLALSKQLKQNAPGSFARPKEGCVASVYKRLQHLRQPA